MLSLSNLTHCSCFVYLSLCPGSVLRSLFAEAEWAGRFPELDCTVIHVAFPSWNVIVFVTVRCLNWAPLSLLNKGGTAIGPTFASLLLFLSSVWWSDENGTLLPINWNSWTSIPALPWFYSLLSAVLVIFEILLLQHKSCVHLWRASNRAHVHDTGGGPLLCSEKIKTKYSCIGLNRVDWLIRSNRNHLVDISVCLCLWPRFQLGSLACLQTEIMITVDLFWFLSIWPECIVLYILLSFSALCELATSLIFPRPVFVRTR